MPKKAKGERLLAAVRPGVVVPASGAVWGAAALMHMAHTPPLDPALVSIAVAGVIYGKARSLTGSAVAAGAWLTAATAMGPLAGPYDAMTALWGAATIAALAALHGSAPVKEAKRWRRERHRWLGQAPQYGLHGSHLLEHEPTRLGERKLLDVTGTRKHASQLASGTLAERIAEDEHLPVSRVQVRPGRIAGHLEISVRHRDPWKHPIPHPVLDPAPELPLPVPGTIREPLPVGQDPESGTPLTLPLWDEDGAKVILIVAKRRSGKTVLLSDLRERITAAEDAQLWDINLSKSVEDREWAPACHLSAAGRHDRRKALAMLRKARQVIDLRGATPRDTPVFQPTAADPLIVLVIDEIDALVSGSAAVKAELDYIASKAGSEGVALVEAGQRGTADWMGGSNVRANIDIVCLGNVNRRGEMMHAAGDMGLTLPDMATYGEGHKGVWVIAETGGDYQVGRTFNLKELTDIRKIAAERAVAREPAMAGGHGGLLDGNSPPPTGIDQLDKGSLEDALPDELREKLRRIDEKNAQTRQTLAETNEIIANLPTVDPAKLAELHAERWRQAAEQTEIPADGRAKLLALLAGEGMSSRKITEAFPGVKRWQIALWLNRLRHEGLAQVAGKGRAAKWVLSDRGESQ